MLIVLFNLCTTRFIEQQLHRHTVMLQATRKQHTTLPCFHVMFWPFC